MKTPVSPAPADEPRWAIERGDVLHKLQSIGDNTFDGLMTDPPYGLGFMGHDWDSGVPNVEVWKEALRVCKPGAFLLAFGGTRTFHRLVSSLEDAGWENGMLPLLACLNPCGMISWPLARRSFHRPKSPRGTSG